MIVSPKLGVLGSLERFAFNEAPRPTPQVPGLLTPGKLSEEQHKKWKEAEQRYESVLNQKP